MPEYTLAAGCSVLVVVGLELLVLRTGLFAKPAYWISLVIVLAFQVLVDGWLTKLSAPIVLYAREHASGVRFPWDIPVEDFAFGFSLMTLTLVLWERQERRTRARAVPTRGALERSDQQDHPEPEPPELPPERPKLPEPPETGRASNAPRPPASPGRGPARET